MKVIFFLITTTLLVGFSSHVFAESEKLVVLETLHGDIVIEFFPDDAPNHVNNFISLAESGFYDGVLFHRIIPGFMIQGGDPNTIDGDPETWGIGGPDQSVDAEFNTIKHNRGIVSMARSADPNSGGSQFFIVHADSNFLDEQYTVFGRIVTDESFEILDRIAEVQTNSRDAPLEPEQVRITKATLVERSEISNLLELDEPDRTQTEPESTPEQTTQISGSQKFESPEHEVIIEVPAGWMMQTPEKTQPDTPDIIAVGPKTGMMNPVISMTAQDTGQRTFDELISEKLHVLQQAIDQGNLKINSKEKKIINGFEAYEVNAAGYFSVDGQNINVKFREILIYTPEKFYTLAYTNGLDEFNSELPRFEETVDTFTILSEDPPFVDESNETGGCLIATAAFGSELAPQVQQLRELRDNTILSTASGTAFMTGFNQLYYSFSPTIADWERENPMFQKTVRVFITPMITTLSIMTLVDTGSEVEVLGYGISVIALNLAMYIAAPAVFAWQIKKRI